MNFFALKICFITLILCLFKVSKATESVDISRDFKILLTYFSEAFLKGATFDGKELEGDHQTSVARYLIEAIGNLAVDYSNLPELDELMTFKEQLAAGIPLAEAMISSQSQITLKADALNIQTQFIGSLKEKGGVILPITWKGHALSLIVRKGKMEDTVDFAIVNTGQGLQFHYHSADPNGVYPTLSQIWMEFVGVKGEELFGNDAWFFQGLITLQKDFFQNKLKKLFADANKKELPDYYPEYFYGSFLANFKDNLAPPRQNRLIPMQRSGSCALSSLIGALLYTSKSENSFYLHRLKIGHVLIKSFLDKAKVNERFKTIIKDGFETNGRNFFKGIGSSLAQKTLEYLEFALPDHFKHAGLIGSERFKWVFEKKEAANKALMEADEVIYESIIISIQLINEIMSFLKANPISNASNDIVLTEKERTRFDSLKFNLTNVGNSGESSPNRFSKDFYNFLKGACNRIEKPLKSFDEFYKVFMQFIELKETNSTQVLYSMLNVFQRAQKYGNDHYWLESATQEQILALQNSCRIFARSFQSIENKFVSFDVIVLLAYLQKLTWKLAVAYDQKLPEEKILGLALLAPPQTLQTVLFGLNFIHKSSEKIKLLAGHLENFIIHNCFDQKNVELFVHLLKQDEMENDKIRFMGPESFCEVLRNRCRPTLPDKNRDIYLKMMEHPDVDSILGSLVNNPNPNNKWSKMDVGLENSAKNHGKFIIVFSKGQSKLFKHFPHYYNLMDTLNALRIGSLWNGGVISYQYWAYTSDIYSVNEDPNEVKITMFRTDDDFQINCGKTVSNIFKEFSFKNNYETIFYYVRHSLALTETIDIVSLETWFNYIKGSSNAKLFDSTYFQYITDHLLNVPKFDTQQKVMFPIDDLTARTIINELSRLIQVSLEAIKVQNEQISSEKMKKSIIRAVNVSVIVTRFISRIDSENILTGTECATSLTRIYNLLIPFSNFKTNYFLAEQEISRINFALGHICSVPIRNVLTFMDNVELETGQKGMRKTLKRYHWFAAKKGYITSGVGISVADDQFNYGTSNNPMTPEETSFLKVLLIKYFLPVLINDQGNLNISDYNFSYNYDMYLVRIQNQIEKVNVIINLWTGAVVFNELCIINNSIFINSQKFQVFFTPENLPLVSNGIAAEVAGKTIYALPDFKGSSYFISREISEGGLNEITIHKKWNRNWYDLTTVQEINASFKGMNFNYDWIINDSWIFQRGQKSREIIVVPKGDIDPVMRFVLDETTSTLNVEVDGLIEGSNWTVFSWAGLNLVHKNESGGHSSLNSNYANSKIIAHKNESGGHSRLNSNDSNSKIIAHKKESGEYFSLNSNDANSKIIAHKKESGGYSSLNSNAANSKISFQRHFDSFTRGNYILVKDDRDCFVIICMTLRLPEDMKRPVVFREKARKEGSLVSEFEILNMPNSVICSNQSLRGSSSLPGGLVISSDSKKALILPIAAKDQDTKSTILVEKIPILDDDEIAPQARVHKLLLAYYMILQFEFKSARDLLQPSASIHHNDAFSIQEIDILKWISGIDLEAPEALALKIFAYLHYDYNRRKFPLEHSNYELEDITVPDTYKYLFSIREMSEKYYVFLNFPEIFEKERFYKLFAKSLTPFPEHTVDDDAIWGNININIRNNINVSYDVGNRIDSSFINLVLSKDFESLNFASKLMFRRSHKNSFEKQTEMAVFCYVNDPNLWMDFNEKLFALTDASLISQDRENGEKETEEIYRSVMDNCINKYKYLFKGVDQSFSMTVTSLETLRSTFEAEVNRLRINVLNDNLKLRIKTELVTLNDIQIANNAEFTLRNLLNAGNDTSSLDRFDYETSKDSFILTKLRKSIEDFVSENGQCTKSEIDLDTNISTLNSILTLLSSRINELSAAQEISISNLIADINSDVCSSSIGSILSLMHQRKVKTFESLYACYLKDSLVCIQKKLPQLSLEQCMEVKEKAKIFYSRQILIKYFEMLKETVENFRKLTENNEPVSVDDLSIFCDELSKIENFNSRMKDPVIMNFEFRSQKYRLKPEQVRDVGLLTTADSSTKLFPSVVIQRMMAAGKTLVLGTISVVKKALDSTQLSILVPPSSLYQSNTTAMQARTYQYFKKKGINFTFPRFEIPTKEKGKESDDEADIEKEKDSTHRLEKYLKTVNELITNTMNENNYLILSPESLHSFLNSYIEALLNAERNWDQKYQEILKGYAQIYRIFKQRGSIILDEIDMTMDPKKELNFPTQETESYNMTAVTMLTDIMEFMVFDENIIDAGLRIHSNNQASLTATNYRDCIKLVMEYIKSQLNNTSSLWYGLVFGSNSHDTSVNEIMEFLQDPNMDSKKEWIIRFHGSGNQIIADALIIVKNQLHNQMEHAFKGTVNLNFGSSGSSRPEIKYAIPYAAANTPSADSVFADRWETLVKTLLMVSASPCSLEIAKDLIEYFRFAISAESVISQTLEATVTYRNWKLILPGDLCPLTLESKNITHVQAVHKALGTRSPAAIRLLFTFYITQVFDKMTFPTEQISSNALNVASMFNSVQGYSGTIDNVNILPQHVVKDAFEDNMRNEKYNGGISLKLIRDCDDGIVQELNEAAFTKQAREMVRDLLALYSSEQVSAIIDAGAYFKNFKNMQVAEAILSSCNNVKAVLYYDEDSNQLEFLRSSNGLYTRGILETSDPDDITRATQVQISRRFTFYDQRHITGSDILQPKTAHAIMTAGPRVLLRDILQGALRMRQFMTSQKVHLVTTEASRKFYASKIMEDKTKINVSDLLTLGALNEEEKQENENVKLAFGKINAEIRAFVLDEISRALLENSENSQEFVLEMTTSAKSLFLKAIREVPLDWLHQSKNENTAYILKLFAVSRLHPLKNVMNNFTSHVELQKRYNSMKKRLKDMISPENKKYFYAKETIPTSINLDFGSEVQQQTLTLTMTDLNMDNQVMENVNGQFSFEIPYCILDDLASTESDESISSNRTYRSFTSLKSLYEEKYLDKSFKPLLENTLVTEGNRVGVTSELIDIIRSSWKNDTHYPIFSKYTFEGSHLVVQLFNDNLKVFLVSSFGASDFLEKFKNIRAYKKYTYFDDEEEDFDTFSEDDSDKFTEKDSNKFGGMDSYGASDILSDSKYWLCDLSGTVTATNDTGTGRGDNVLDFIPQIDKLMFDLLTFNGSLPQILANPKLKAIYDDWLKSEHFKLRAMFLRLRMKALMEKEKEIFEEDDQNLKFLQDLSMGIKNSSESVVAEYPKGAIDFDFETQKMALLGINSANQESFSLGLTQTVIIEFDITSEIRQLFKIPLGTLSELSGPDFVSEEDSIFGEDANSDEREIPNRPPHKHKIIKVAKYPLAEKKLYNDQIKVGKVNEELDTEIVLTDLEAEYQEPALTLFKPTKLTEIFVNLKSKKTETVEKLKDQQNSEDNN